MKLGIDFGTTRIVAAAVDRGNYPVITFEDSEGTGRDWFPALVASRNGQRLYGWDAWQAQFEPGWTLVRSLKRLMQDAGPYTMLEIDGASVPVLQVLEEMTTAFRLALVEKSSLPANAGDPMEAMLGVPANANSNQRFLTIIAVSKGQASRYWAC